MNDLAATALQVLGAAVGAWAAISVELRFVWRDVDDLRKRMTALERQIK